MKSVRTTNWIGRYYLLTPLFLLLDYLFGASFRISGLVDPAYRLAYYGFCMLCAAGCYLETRYAPLIAIAESSINLLILMLSVMIPIAYLGDLAGNAATLPGLDSNGMLNFLLSGGILLTVFYTAQQDLRNRSD